MKIWHCLRCDQDWASRGDEPPKRCGKCKSPYWNGRPKPLPISAINSPVHRTDKPGKVEDYLTAPDAVVPFPDEDEPIAISTVPMADSATREAIPWIRKQVVPVEGWQEWMEDILPRALRKFQELRGRLPLNYTEWATYVKRGY